MVLRKRTGGASLIDWGCLGTAESAQHRTESLTTTEAGFCFIPGHSCFLFAGGNSRPFPSHSRRDGLPWVAARMSLCFPY